MRHPALLPWLLTVAPALFDSQRSPLSLLVYATLRVWSSAGSDAYRGQSRQHPPDREYGAGITPAPE